MKSVSNSYKEVMDQVIRPTTLFQASLEMIDRGVESDATVITSEATHYSTGVFDKVHEGDYATFEQDFFRVGSGMRILPDTDFIKNGYVSSVMCDGNGVFQTVPMLEFTFDHTRSFIAMTYEFAYDYPTQIRVTYYLDGVQQGQFISLPNRVDFIDADNHIYDCDRITFEFLGMSAPYRRLRIARMLFGYEKKFEMGDLLSVDHTLSVDPISSALPYERLILRVNNFSKDYNPDNPQGSWVYFTNGQPLSIRYGVQIDDRVEWVEAGRLFLSDAPTVDATSASFNAVDTISTLTNVYNRGLWRENGVTLYDLAVDVLSDAGVTNYILPDSLKSIVTRAPMSILPHRECLQMIANAGECILYTNPQGTVVIEQQTHEDAPVDFHLDFTKMFDKPTVRKTEMLKSVDVTVHSPRVSAERQELCQHKDLYINGVSEIQVIYETATDIEVSVEGGGLLSARYYANTAFLTIMAEYTATVTVYGHKIVDDTSVATTYVNGSGEVCPVNNPLITDFAHAQSLGEWVATYLKSRNSYDANFRQDYALDVNDVIYVKSDFEDNIPARVTKLQFKLPGQKGAISVRRLK